MNWRFIFKEILWFLLSFAPVVISIPFIKEKIAANEKVYQDGTSKEKSATCVYVARDGKIFIHFTHGKWKGKL